MTMPLNNGPLSALYDILDFLSQLREADEDKVWSRIVDKLAVATGAEAATYYTFLPKLRQLIMRHSLGESAKQLSGTPIDVGTGIAGWVAKHREPVLVADAYADPRFHKDVDVRTGFKTRNVLAVPLHDHLELAGVLELINKSSGAFSAEDHRFVEAACRATSLTLRSFRTEAMVDKVTAHNASILENLGGGFLAVDMRARLILCNPAARKILSISADLPLNLPVEQALKHAPQMAEILTQTLATRKTVKRQDLRWTFEGRERVLGYSTIMIQDPQGNTSGAGITFQDITNVKPS